MIEDGLQTRQKLEVRRMKMENIKADKLEQLKQANIPSYLMHDLVKQKIAI